MKLSNRVLLALAIVGLSAAASARASDLASFTASADPNNNPDANNNTADAWTLTHTGSGTSPENYGSFIGDSGVNGGNSGSDAGAGTSAWGLYANRDGAADFTNEVAIGHTFSGGALTLGQSVSIDFDGAYVDSGGGEYGIRLLGPSGFVFSLAFSGGDTVYRYYDATTSGNSAGVSYDPDGFNFQFTQLTLTTYSVSITSGTTVLGSFSGTDSGSPDFIQVYNHAAGSGAFYDVFANNLQIVPEPASLASIACGGAFLLTTFRRRRKGSA